MTVSHLFSVLNRTTTYKAIISGGKQKNSSELPVSNNDFIKRVSGFWKYKNWKKYLLQNKDKGGVVEGGGGHTKSDKKILFFGCPSGGLLK